MALEFDTAGFTLKYCLETTAGTRPTSGYTEINDIVSLSAIGLQQNTADVTPINETVAHRYIETLPDTGGSYTITANFTSSFISNWDSLRSSAQTGWAGGKALWFEIVFPADSGMTDSFYFSGMPGEVGVPEISVGNAFQGEVTVVIREVVGYDTAST